MYQSKTLHFLYVQRVEIFLVSQLLLLFGSLVLPGQTLNTGVLALFYSLNIATGLIVTLKSRVAFSIVVALLLSSLCLLAVNAAPIPLTSPLIPHLAIYFAFHIMVAIVLIDQMLVTTGNTYRVVLGVLSGYISIGMVAFFLFTLIEHVAPGSFKGLPPETADPRLREEALMYVAFVTLMTIGYGDIVPLTPIARKAAVLVGLAGQFYVVVLTAIIVGKFMRLRAERKK